MQQIQGTVSFNSTASRKYIADNDLYDQREKKTYKTCESFWSRSWKGNTDDEDHEIQVVGHTPCHAFSSSQYMKPTIQICRPQVRKDRSWGMFFITRLHDNPGKNHLFQHLPTSLSTTRITSRLTKLVTWARKWVRPRNQCIFFKLCLFVSESFWFSCLCQHDAFAF